MIEEKAAADKDVVVQEKKKNKKKIYKNTNKLKHKTLMACQLMLIINICSLQ